MQDRDDTVSTLNDLIETSKDGEYGFRTCAEHADSAQLRTLLQNRASECATAASELAARVVALGGTADTTGSVAGSMHRGWVAVRSALSTFDDLAVLSECERGEDAAKKAYSDALEQDLPADVRALVAQQYEGVQRNHDMIKRMRDSLRAAKA